MRVPAPVRASAVAAVAALSAALPAAFHAGIVRAEGRPEADIVADLKKNAEDIDPRKEGITSREQFASVAKARAEKAKTLLAELEKAAPKSASLNEARASAAKSQLFAARVTQDAAYLEEGKKLAAELKTAAAAGDEKLKESADSLGLQAGFTDLIMGVKSREAAVDAWKKKGEALSKDVRAHMAAHPKAPDGAVLLGQFIPLLGMLGEEKLVAEMSDHLIANYPDFPMTKALKAKKERDTAVGKEFAFDFKLSGSGAKLTNKDLAGKVVVVDFWATWCGPCKAEMPNMKKLYAEYKDKGVEFVGVSLDRSEEALAGYVKENGIGWPQVYGEQAQEFAGKWGIEGIPTLFIVDKKGNLRSMEARGRLEKLIPELLAEK
jgi:thiol-disulfide isomerase/thioredoxin